MNINDTVQLLKTTAHYPRGVIGQTYKIIEILKTELKLCSENEHCFYTHPTNVIKISDTINTTYPLNGSDYDIDHTLDTHTRADRFNQGKTSWELLDFKSLEPMVEVLMFGAEKYSPNNWKKGQHTSELIGSLMRHIVSYQQGEDIDSESGKKHLGHAMCNIMFLIYNNKNHKELDDR